MAQSQRWRKFDQSSLAWRSSEVDMSFKQMSDAQVMDWCSWFTRTYVEAANHRINILVEVNFSNNFLTDTGVQLLLQTLMQEGVRVKSLKIFGNQLTSVDSIEQFLRWSKGTLHELHLSDNRLAANEVCKLFVAALELKNDRGKHCYPVGGKMPFWLRVGGGSTISYDPKSLESLLRQSLSMLGRSLEKDVHVTEDWERGLCSPYKCCRTSPTPAVHGPYLFPHRKKQVPCLLKKVNDSSRINHPPLIFNNNLGTCLDMSSRGLRDEDLPTVFKWMQKEFARIICGAARILLREVNVSNNQLTTNGLTRLVRFFIKNKVQVEILKKRGNASVHGEDVDFTLAVGGSAIKTSKRCSLRTKGCTCGRNCQTFLEPAVLEELWMSRIDLQEGQVHMSNQGIDDLSMQQWCTWFSACQSEIERGTTFEQIDFSINHITAVGAQELVDTLILMGIKVSDLRLYKNSICLDYGGPIECFMTWSHGTLSQLHLSQNEFTASAIADIVLAAIRLNDNEGQPLYPIQRKRPLWLRADKNNFMSPELEDQLRHAMSKFPGKSLDTLLCNVTHAMECNPHKCVNKEFEHTPAIHGVYLFEHWERATIEDVEQSDQSSRSCYRATIAAEQQQLQNALHALSAQMGQARKMQPHTKPVASTTRQERPAKSSLVSPGECPGFIRLKPICMVSMAGATAANGKTNCFTPQTLFRRVGQPDSYISAAELRRGDLLVGPRTDGVRVLSVQTHAKQLRNIVRLRAEHSDAAFVVTSDHRVQIDQNGGSKAAGKIFEEFRKGERPMVYDGRTLHAIKEAKYKKERLAVVEVHFEGDDVASVWLRPRRWRSRSVDCPQIVVRGEWPMMHVTAAPHQTSQEERYGILCRHSFIDDYYRHSQVAPAPRCSSAPPPSTTGLLESD